ncbi:MAG: UDP-N-acetylglucosamine 2-epimerase (non-hydrolyzing) [Deltaproteobacteria bacterium]|jgi:UDP-N-acetylglucosamine 2-epimerase (non-hydrolysing)|nr:UDP-N-acetylglucosamine 2-epimerase (non-hydrolyzing) [Deltaproteobacteria bacterium]
MKICSIIGARPQFIKEAIISLQVQNIKAWDHILVHSGQHYDVNMSDIFFSDFNLPKPKYNLNIGSDTHAIMTAKTIIETERVLLAEKPDAIIVYGDTNTTLAAAIVASKLVIPIIHIEAGIRMIPKSMPEEINRVLVDHISSILCCCSELGALNLKNEGIFNGVNITGDIMYDCFLHMSKFFKPKDICKKYNLENNKYIIATLHRDYNVDIQNNLLECMKGLVKLQKETGYTVIFPLHPRTKKNLIKFGYIDILSQLKTIEPQGYIDLMSLLLSCNFVVTDSGGLQKEAYFAGKRTIVVMPDTGWRELIEYGWNFLSNAVSNNILENSMNLLSSTSQYPQFIYGDGHSKDKIIDCILKFLTNI